MKKIGKYAFDGCESITSLKISEGVTTIEQYAFWECSNLTTVSFPKSIKKVECEAFYNCPSLSEIIVQTNIKIFEDCALGWPLPNGLIERFESVYPYLSDDALFEYLVHTDLWKHLSLSIRADIFLYTKGRFASVYEALLLPGEEEKLGRQILDNLTKDTPEDYCLASYKYLASFSNKLSDQLIQDTYAKLKSFENGIRATRAIESDSSLKNRIMVSEEAHPVLTVEQKVMDLLSKNDDQYSIKKALYKEYSISIETLPVLLDKDGKVTDPTVLAWLLIKGRQETRKISDEEKEIIAFLNTDSFMNALKALAIENLGIPGRSKKMFLAYPICRYADEDLLYELTKRASNWRSSNSGNNAPPLATFRSAILYNDSHTAMLFADKYGDLDRYAKLRRMKEDKFRNEYLSYVDLDKEGNKRYDLGNQTVVVKMQKDFSFIVEVPGSGKTVKSLPKQGSEPSKYESANKDFSKIKKEVKKITKNRCNLLWREFLDDKDCSVGEWKRVYLKNPVLKNIASLLVWKQGMITFTLTDSGIVDNEGLSIKLSNERIKLAHPMELDKTEVEAWQKFYAQKGLKQPFAQIWEPVINSETIKENRYSGCMIPYKMFRNMEKHGIRVEDKDYHNDIFISFDDCDVYDERIDWHRHEINNEDRFEIQRFGFKEYNRKVNHIVAYLDRVTIFDRIKKDDSSIEETIKSYNLAQILECVDVANKNGSKNCLAVLLEEKNKRWPEYSSISSLIMDEM